MAAFLTSPNNPATPARPFDLNVVAEIVARTRHEQGLSRTVTDPGVIARLAVLVKSR